MKEVEALQQKQPFVYAQLHKSFLNGRLSHAYLFEGEAGTGKQQFGKWLAKCLFCVQLDAGNPCNQCVNCRRIQADMHPDVVTIAPQGQMIKVEQIKALQETFSKTGMETAKKILFIAEAEKMNGQAANRLLKFLEEPSGEIFAVLETTALAKILPTIQSRCQIVHFQTLSKAALQQMLEETGIDPANAAFLAAFTNSFDKAVEISRDEWFNEARKCIQQWVDYLKKKDNQSFLFVQQKMHKLFKDKTQQATAFELMIVFFSQAFSNDVPTLKSERLSHLLQARRKWEANVSFQAVCEQLVIRILHPKLETGG